MSNEQCKWCENKAISRGLCARHYARAKSLVSDGTNWEVILAGDEPKPAKRGRKMKTGRASWLAQRYDELAFDVAKAIALIELGNTEEAKRVLIGEWSGTSTIIDSIQHKVEKCVANCERSHFVANVTENDRNSH